MPTIGLGEILLAAFVALLVIGPKQLPTAARQLGLFIHQFKMSANVIKDDLLGRNTEITPKNPAKHDDK